MENIIFGGSGPTGIAVARYLASKGHNATCVSRTGRLPKELQDLGQNVVCVQGDVLHPERCKEICVEAKRIYFCVGLEYSSSVWKRDFPVALENVLKATPKTAVFVMADNLYCFGEEQKGKLLTPDLPFTSIGVKPKLRGEMDQTILRYHAEGKCNTVIVRASDFYGPRVLLSALGENVFGKIRDNAAPMLVQPIDKRHAFTYNPDFAEALVEVSMEPNAYGKAFHCPNAECRTPREVVQAVGEAYSRPDLGAAPSLLVGWMRRGLGWFVGPLAEMEEMEYQWAEAFEVDHSRYLDLFPHSALPTPMADGIRETAAWYEEHRPSNKGWFG